MTYLLIGALAALVITSHGAEGAENEIIGTPRADSLVGTPQDDRIDALGGNDRARGREGDDTVRGRKGDDRLRGDDGDDTLRGDGGDDVLQGGDGDDTIAGNGGNDIIRGGPGNDLLKGNGGRDVIRGDGGSDTIDGGGGPDTLTGGRGADQFVYRSRVGSPDEILDFNTGQNDSLELSGKLKGAATRFVVRGRNTNVSVRARSADAFAPLTVLKNTSMPIDVWLGDRQEFGSPGEAQRWVNILGRVDTRRIAAFSYSLNGGLARPLQIGPNNGRLQDRGDFNVEIAYAELDPSATDDVVSIEATYQDGRTFRRDVTVVYEGGAVWPKNYAIDWRDVTDLQEVVQVVDGHWAFDRQGVRPVEAGYDRILAMGDAAWDGYTARLTFTVHSWESDELGRAFWLGMQWGGHTDDPIPDVEPHEGYVPVATFMIQDRVVVLRPSEVFEERIPANPMVGQGVNIVPGRTYNVLVRNERVATDTNLLDGLDRTYSIKIWPVGTAEPAAFLISQTMINQEPFGSFLVFPHYVEATIGNITIEALPAPVAQQNARAD